MNYNIRPIEPKDFPTLVKLFSEFAHFEKTPEKMVNSAVQMQKDAKWINGFVAVDEANEIQGYVTWFYAYYTWVGKSMYMDDLYVRPDYRGKSIGTKLIQSVIDHAKKEHCGRLRWQVSEWNAPAIKFYEKLGANVDGVESNCDLVLNR